MDTKILKDSFAAVAPRGPELVEWFYADLFYLGGREVRDMFPPAMTAQRDRLLGALVQIVTSVDDLDTLAAYLDGLGRDHRKFGVLATHYDLVGRALLNTLAHFAGNAWTPEVAGTWTEAYTLVAQVMRDAAAKDEASPAWWDAVVSGTEQRPPDVAVIRATLAQPMPWRAGQSMAVQFAGMPRVWRPYSPANAPGGTGQEVVFHVKIADGGLLSTALARRAQPGDVLRLGPPFGNLPTASSAARPLLMIAGGTGLAPLLSIVEEITTWATAPAVDLFFGARTPEGLYDLPALEKLAADHPWLKVVHTVDAPPQATPGYVGEHGNVVDAAGRRGPWTGHDAYVCGPTRMVAAAKARLAALGVPAGQVHAEDFGLEG